MPSARRGSVAARKRAAVVDAARLSFLDHGFAATNMDEVAAAARVSKMTVYSHFASKEVLFREVLEAVIAERSAGGPELDADLEANTLAEALTSIAVDLVETVQDPDVVGLRRVLVAEQPRQPELAATWRRSTVLPAVDALAGHVAALQGRGLLEQADPRDLASQFVWMLIGDPLDAALLDPAGPQPEARVLAAGVVRTVLRAYGGPQWRSEPTA